MEIGTIGHPVFVAILKAPSLNGSIVNSSPLLRVPSGRYRWKYPSLHNQLPAGLFSVLPLDSLGRGRDNRRNASRWKEAELFHFFFRNIAGQVLASAVGKQNVKETAVIPDEENRLIRYILLTDHSDFHTGHFQNHFKSPLDNTQRTDVTRMWVEFTDHPSTKKTGIERIR